MNVKAVLWTSFGLGLSPFASGTVGSLGGVALAAVALLLPAGLPAQLYLAGAALAVFLVGIPLGDAAERHYGRKDPGPFVIDEVAGYLVTVIGHPLHAHPLLVLGAAFFAFRATDVLKPWPANVADKKLPGGLGIMLDDVFAGVYANACLWILFALI